jgi:hypothetical protein
VERAGRRSIQALARASLPFLRVIGLVYTGLGGMIALVLVIAVGVTPVAPVIEQATEPARQAVTSLMQPTSDAVVSLLGSGVQVRTAPPPRVFSPTLAIDVTIEDVQVAEAPADETIVEEPPAAPVHIVWAPHTAIAVEPIEADVVVEEEPEAVDPLLPEPSTPASTVVQAGEPVLVIAVEQAPKPLPTPTPTETPQQLKARLDAENHAAIEAQKAAQARAKADADAANRAAIEAAKLAKANAEAQQKAANRAAIAAAKGAPSLPAPTAQPIPTPPAIAAPPPPAEPEPTQAEPAAPPIAEVTPHADDPDQSDEVEAVDESQLDEAPINLALEPCDSST